jgi:hypothetical protein
MASHCRHGLSGSTCTKIHEQPRSGPYKKGSRLCSLDHKKAIRKFRRFNSHLVAGNAQPARWRRRTIALQRHEIGGKLLRPRWSVAAEQKACNSEQAQP